MHKKTAKKLSEILLEDMSITHGITMSRIPAILNKSDHDALFVAKQLNNNSNNKKTAAKFHLCKICLPPSFVSVSPSHICISRILKRLQTNKFTK